MLIRLPAMLTWMLVVLILAAICPGCARRNILFESKQDLMPCDEFGGKVSISMRGEPVGPDKPRRMAVRKAAIPVAPCWTESSPGPRPLPPVERAPTQPGPIFFAPPSLSTAQLSPITQTGFDQAAPTDNTVFASYPGPTPFDPGYGPPSVVAPGDSLMSPPGVDVDPLSVMASCDEGRFSGLRRTWREARQSVCCDYRNYYHRETMSKLAYGLVLGSVLANTSMDRDVQDWYQQDVRSEETDDFAAFWKPFGEGHLFIPSYACLAVACKLLEDRPVFDVAGDFGSRTTRAYLVGAPPMLFMQFMLGGSRPGETSHGSYWDPFQDTNAVSGHAFIGAVPFITAAKMTDNFFLKSGFYACSTFTGFSRINDDSHYLSQVVLGWWMAYLACEAVDQTQLDRQGLTVMPVATPNSVGFGAVWEY